MANRILGKAVLPLSLCCVFSQSAVASDVAPLASGAYANSIRNEALTGFADGRETPAILQNSIVAGTISGMKAQAEAGVDPSLPTVESLMPAVPLTLADGRVTAQVAPSSAGMAYNGDDQRFNINLGMGYYNPEQGDGGVMGSGGFSTMIGSQVAVGSSVVIYDLKRDVVLNSVWQVPNSGLRFKLSGGYLWGDQEFDFASGNQTMGLEQYSYGLSMTWSVPEQGDGGLFQSIGASLWGAEANQTSQPEAINYMDEDDDNYYFYRDPLKLSEGKLIGFSGDLQLAFAENLITKASLGYERLRYPFADGTSDINNALFSDLDLFWEPVESITVGAGWKNGVSEDRFTTSIKSGHFILSGWYSQGETGLQDDKGAMLTYSLFTEKHPKGTSLARRMQPSRATGSPALLSEVMERPAYMPETFLAKVDLTAVTLEATVSKTALSSVATVDSTSGDIYVTITGGAASITAATAQPWAEVIAGQLVVHTAQMPEGAATYVVTVTNELSVDYNVTIVTE